MPFITIRTNQKIEQEQQEKIKAGLGKAISFVPGKSEESLMVMFEDKSPIYLRGDGSRPMAFLDVAVYGNESHQGYQEFSLYTTKLINEVLKIDPRDIFIDYRDIPAFGVGGYVFER